MHGPGFGWPAITPGKRTENYPFAASMKPTILFEMRHGYSDIE